MQRLRDIALNAGLVGSSLLVFAVVLEFVVFRFVLLPSDLPRNAFVDGVIKYQPNQTGIDRVANDYAHPYRINAEGWNSGHAAYPVARTPGIERIAVIGDSFVEAFQVPYDRSFAERLEARYAEAGQAAEVFRFGISGAPLSQYLHMLEREVLAYRPDRVIVLLVHNDFDESFRFVAGRYTSSYRKLVVEDGQVTGFVEPTAYRGTYEPLVQSATYRYLKMRQGLSVAALRALVLGGGKEYAANIPVEEVLALRPEIEAAVNHVMARFAALADEHGFEILFLMDADREAIYGLREEDRQNGVLALNDLASTAASRHGLPFVDLHPLFKTDFERHGTRFDYPRDSHWNQHAHDLVARLVGDRLLREPQTARAGTASR
ncbi:MAG: SGNH/GDSL hydrolase family protein [Pseudomonadota bacterium]